MILWSIEPVERIFPQEIPKTATMGINNGYIECFENKNGFTVSRLVSTNPKDYLRKEYSPGSVYR